jgi:hypothetical protein
MSYSEYYKNYRGPTLTKVTLDKIIDITDIIKEVYGEENNWQGKLWKFKEIFGNECEGKQFYCEFHSEDGRKHWFNGFIEDKNQHFNPPLATPMRQN